MQPDTQTPLFPGASSSIGTIEVNSRCLIVGGGETRVAVVAGVPVARIAEGDRDAEDLFIAQALENGHAKPGEITEALRRPLRTVHRVRRRFVEGGPGGLASKKRGPKGPRLGAQREAAIRRWHREGMSVNGMARRLGVSWNTVQAAVYRMGLQGDESAKPSQGELWEAIPARPADGETDVAIAPDPAPGEAATQEDDTEQPEADAEQRLVAYEPPPCYVDPMDRSIDRALAAFGQLDDAAPLFALAEGVPRAGVLLAVPLLVASGVFDTAAKAYGSIGPAFYGLRTILLALLFLGLLRIKRPENVKEYSPSELGRILGLDRAPEVKTIRRKLARMAQDERALERFAGDLVKRRVERASEALGFLYVDGHVRVYNGKHDLPKAHVARLRLSLPATQDVWVNDADGAPLFFITQEAHPQLVSALRKVLGEVRELVGKERRVTVVFDRGGWSPKLFQWMDANGFDVLTYRKNKADPLPPDRFASHQVDLPQGKEDYELADTETEVAKGFKMRQVTRRKGDHQTHIVTTRRDLPVTEVAVRMFDRWRQENFFRYMRQEFAIDALVDYGIEAADARRLVPNPSRKALDKELREAKAEVLRLEAAYGEAAMDNQEGQRPTMRGFKIANGTTLGIPLRKARARVEELAQKRRAQPTKVAIGQIKDAVVRLRRSRKRLSDSLKMLAYQVETDIVRAVAPHFKRSLDEGRTLVSAALASTADIEPTEDELRITLAAQSSPHRTRAIATLCDILNATDTRFPGTKLRLRYAIHGDDRAT